jgi:hypothetical protein
MAENQTPLNQVRKIDNSRQWLPFFTSILLIFLIILFIWFFRGGSFRLYASAVFLIYSLTHQIWISVILLGIIQNIVFLPLRVIGSRFHKSIKDFEDELEKTEGSEDQYFVKPDSNQVAQQLRQGSLPIVFYIFNFFVQAIAFSSAVRIFLIDFYSDPLKLQKMNLLYDFIPYPKYPLQGTDFKVPLFKITETTAVSWQIIIWIVVGLIIIPTVLRLIWRLVRFFLQKNKQILNARIRYNRLLLKMGGLSGVVALIVIFILRHIPSTFEGFTFIADLTRRNIPMNFVTALATFFLTFHSGYKNHQAASREALKSGIPQKIIDKVFKEKMRQSFKNGIILGLGAFFITNNIPSAFELSVTTFEVMSIIYPYTFGLILKKSGAIAEIVKEE